MFRKKIALALVFSFLLSIPAFADQNAPVPPTTVSPINPPIVSENWAESTGTITAIQKDQITISINGGKELSDLLVLNLSKDTVFEKCTLSMLAIGQKIHATHSMATTRSLPPQTATYTISLIQDANQTFLYTGLVKEISSYKDTTMLRLVAMSAKEVNQEIIFNVSKDTKWEGGTLADVEKGKMLTVTYGMAMTMSIPPQTAALSIKINKEEPALLEDDEIVGRITQVTDMKDFLLVRVTGKINGKSNQNILLIVTSETELEDAHMKDLKAGKKIQAEFKILNTSAKHMIAVYV